MKTLNEVREFLNGIPYINSGGCAIAALAMYRWLKKNNGLKQDTEFVYLYFYKSGSYEQNCCAINGAMNPASCSHVVLWHNGHYIDSKDLYSKFELEEQDYQYFLPIPNENFIINSINFGLWNYQFERSWVEEIQDELGIDLSGVMYDSVPILPDFKSCDYNFEFKVSSNNVTRLYP